jgi:uncharacterized Zn-finger protein
MLEDGKAGRLATAVTGGRVVVTPGEVQPYKVVLEHAHMNDTEHAFGSMREGEAFIRSEMPVVSEGAFFGAAGAREAPWPERGRTITRFFKGSPRRSPARDFAGSSARLDSLQADLEIGVWDNEGGCSGLSVPMPPPLRSLLPHRGARSGVPRFLNDVGSAGIDIGVRAFNCIGATPPADHPHIYLDMGQRPSVLCPYCATLFRHDPALSVDETRPVGCFCETPSKSAVEETIQ